MWLEFMRNNFWIVLACRKPFYVRSRPIANRDIKYIYLYESVRVFDKICGEEISPWKKGASSLGPRRSKKKIRPSPEINSIHYFIDI